MKKSKSIISVALTTLTFILTANGAFAQTYNILDFGAKSSHTQLSTEAIHAAIDACSADDWPEATVNRKKAFRRN